MIFPSCLLDVFISSNVQEKSKTFTEIYRKLETERYENNNTNSCCASNNLNTCLEMDSLLHIENKKQKLHQIVQDFNFHSVVYLAKRT